MKISQRLAAGGLAFVMASGLMVAAPTAARASDEGRRNTAIALAVAAGIVLLSQNHHRDRCDDGYRYSRHYDRYDRDCDRYDRYDRYSRYDRSYDRDYRDCNRYDRYDSYDRYDRYDRCRR